MVTVQWCWGNRGLFENISVSTSINPIKLGTSVLTIEILNLTTQSSILRTGFIIKIWRSYFKLMRVVKWTLTYLAPSLHWVWVYSYWILNINRASNLWIFIWGLPFICFFPRKIVITPKWKRCASPFRYSAWNRPNWHPIGCRVGIRYLTRIWRSTNAGFGYGKGTLSMHTWRSPRPSSSPRSGTWQR